MDVFYRHHRFDAPEFSAENAFSAQWGVDFDERGIRYRCLDCDGAGPTPDAPCSCDGGWMYADRGYSCCWTAGDLLAYHDEHCPLDADDPVVVFEGRHCGDGGDGEPLAVPIRVIRWTTAGELRGGTSLDPPDWDEEWTTSEVARRCGITRASVARAMRVISVEPSGSREERGGVTRLWPALLLWELRAGRSGSGNRTSGEGRRGGRKLTR